MKKQIDKITLRMIKYLVSLPSSASGSGRTQVTIKPVAEVLEATVGTGGFVRVAFESLRQRITSNHLSLFL